MRAPGDRRLLSDYERVLALVAASKTTLNIDSMSGNPPNGYVIRYRCRGVERVTGKRPIYREEHRVRIDLPVAYPGKQPLVQLLTPIFHPNVWPNNIVCLGGHWRVAEYLDNLILRIGAIIQYDKDYLNLQSVANVDARAWAERNMQLFPVGRCTFKNVIDGPQEIQEIKWMNLA